ncbi:hypothetical protein GY21_01705 [Cryobacterium roopkundense]|uniref:PH domain-containing protein n=1 Tax=Cryobacterium roopkundense TaxID=1001240 RepID=A0A099JSJ6_9MICO|nr:PH domain-containing protein [Cryobacterium roopkundense]KGJ81106.1 hypothetical protein GY21_01705 [Cryobacterium roopkundense]MBB5641901.1 hypothetical protein [Cryobacterium roopkundense]
MTHRASEPEIIGSRFNRTVCVVVWAVAGIMLLSAFFGGGEATLRSAPTIALLAYAGWVVLWRPNLVITDEHVSLRNVVTTVVVPWSALIQVDTRFALTLVTPGHRYSAWVAPAPGALTSQRMARRSRKAENENPLERSSDGRSLPGELRGSESGDAARRVRARWDALIEAGAVQTGTADTTPVTRTMHVTVLGVLAALLGLSLTAALI